MRKFLLLFFIGCAILNFNAFVGETDVLAESESESELKAESESIEEEDKVKDDDPVNRSDVLAKLTEFYEAGLLTEDQFNKAKAKMLK